MLFQTLCGAPAHRALLVPPAGLVEWWISSLLLRGATWGLHEGLSMEAVLCRPPGKRREPGVPSETPEPLGGGEAGEPGSWTLISPQVLWNMMRSWPGSGRPTSTPSTSSWGHGSMSRGPPRRPQTSLPKVGGHRAKWQLPVRCSTADLAPVL